MSTPELAASWKLRAHYSIDLQANEITGGRSGNALCNGNAVYDEDALNAYYRVIARGGRRVVMAELSLCKHCTKRVSRETRVSA